MNSHLNEWVARDVRAGARSLRDDLTAGAPNDPTIPMDSAR
jgi:hypothetical protein